MNFNQQTVTERKLYAGLDAFSLKSIGLTKEQMIQKGYSENFANAFGKDTNADIPVGQETAIGIKFTAILESKTTGEEFPLTFRMADIKLAPSSKGSVKYYSDALEDVWVRDIEHLREIVNSRSDYYGTRCKTVLDYNPRPARVGEIFYYRFLEQIIHPKREDSNRNTLMPVFYENLKNQGLSFDTIVKGDFTAFEKLVEFLNSEENKTVDYVAIPVVITTSDAGRQNMRLETGYDGENFYRTNGSIGAGTITAFKKYIDGRQSYNHFAIYEPLRVVEAAELVGGNQPSMDDEKPIENLSNLV